MTDAAKLTTRVRRPDPCPFHVVVEGSSIGLGKLDPFDADTYRQTFRGHLYRVARHQFGGMPPGILFAAVHGAYDPNTRTFPIHMHGVATGGKIAVVDALRTLPMYRPAVAGDGRDAARIPISMPRKVITDLPSALGYAFKPFWPLRPTILAPDGLRTALKVPVMRIREEPAASEYLRFLDRWSVNQLTLIMGMRACSSGFIRL